MQRDRLLIEEMIDAASRAIDIAEVSDLSQLEADRDRREALLWNFTVLGEAASRVSADLKARHEDIAWSQPSRLRNRIVHGYWSIDLSILHTTANDELPALKDQLCSVLETVERSDEDEPPHRGQLR